MGSRGWSMPAGAWEAKLPDEQYDEDLLCEFCGAALSAPVSDEPWIEEINGCIIAAGSRLTFVCACGKSTIIYT